MHMRIDDEHSPQQCANHRPQPLAPTVRCALVAVGGCIVWVLQVSPHLLGWTEWRDGEVGVGVLSPLFPSPLSLSSLSSPSSPSQCPPFPSVPRLCLVPWAVVSACPVSVFSVCWCVGVLVCWCGVSVYEVTVCISLMGKIRGCHCISQAMPQNIQQHTQVMTIIT